jgi:hypothetical protein
MLIEIVRTSDSIQVVFRYKRGSPPPVNRVASMFQDLEDYGYDIQHIRQVKQLVIAQIRQT